MSEPTIPDAAVQAATRAIGINIQLRKMPSDMARAVLEAAAPHIAEHIAQLIEARRCPKSDLCNSCVCRPEDAKTARAAFPKETP